MFRPGKVLKVKVELSPDVVGFGRATIVETDGGHLFLQLKTSKGEKRSLPKGTRVWFVSDGLNHAFNGLWSTSVVSTRIVSGKTAIECTRPKFESLVQKRRQRRVVISCPVRLHGQLFEGMQANTRNLSSSGVGIEVLEDCSEHFKPGHHEELTIETPQGAVVASVRVIQSRYNWLANKTDVGLEFIDIAPESEQLIASLLDKIESQPRHAPDAKERGGGLGQLSGWLKSTKDNVSFVKTSGSVETLSAEDISELTEDLDSENA